MAESRRPRARVNDPCSIFDQARCIYFGRGRAVPPCCPSPVSSCRTRELPVPARSPLPGSSHWGFDRRQGTKMQNEVPRGGGKLLVGSVDECPTPEKALQSHQRRPSRAQTRGSGDRRRAKAPRACSTCDTTRSRARRTSRGSCGVIWSTSRSRDSRTETAQSTPRVDGRDHPARAAAAPHGPRKHR